MAGLRLTGSCWRWCHAGCPCLPGGGKSGDCAPSSWRRGRRARGRRSPPPPSPPLPSGRAPRLAEDSRKRRRAGAAAAGALPGEDTFLLALRSEKPRVDDPPRALAPDPRERAPRIAAATTCLQLVASGPRSRPAGGALGVAE